MNKISFTSSRESIWLKCIIKNICEVTNDSESIISQYFLLYHMLCSQKIPSQQKYYWSPARNQNSIIHSFITCKKKKFWCYIFVNSLNHIAKMYKNFFVTYSDFTLPKLFKANFTFRLLDAVTFYAWVYFYIIFFVY